MVRTLRASLKVAQDETWGAAEHQRGGTETIPNAVYNLLISDDTECWREVPRQPDPEGLHFCLDRNGDEFNNVHIDWIDPCSGRTASGMCEYDWGVSYTHWRQAMGSRGVPSNPFALMEPGIEEFEQLLARSQNRPPPASASGSSSVAGVTTRPRRDREEIEIEFADIHAVWVSRHRRFAVLGYRGWDQATRIYHRLRELTLFLEAVNRGEADLE
jgi:hypothetical protein